jgi:TRAP-type uncharacterized transport system substrate-binding protein
MVRAMKHDKRWWIFSLLAGLLSLVGCSNDANQSAPSAPPAAIPSSHVSKPPAVTAPPTVAPVAKVAAVAPAPEHRPSQPPVLPRPVNLRLCAGQPDGNYPLAATSLAEQAKKANLRIEPIRTGGARDNIKRLSKGECDAAIVQSDAYYVFSHESNANPLAIALVGPLFDEYVHLVCNEKSQVKDIRSFKSPKMRSELLIGSRASGSHLAWQTFSFLDFAYANARTFARGGQEAFDELLLNDKGRCMLHVSALQSPLMKKVDAKGAGLRLLPVNDGKFDNKKDAQKNRLYHFAKIENRTYPKLQKKYFGGVKTLKLQALLLASESWARSHKAAMNVLRHSVDTVRPMLAGR